MAEPEEERTTAGTVSGLSALHRSHYPDSLSFSLPSCCLTQVLGSSSRGGGRGKHTHAHTSDVHASPHPRTCTRKRTSGAPACPFALFFAQKKIQRTGTSKLLTTQLRRSRCTPGSDKKGEAEGARGGR